MTPGAQAPLKEGCPIHLETLFSQLEDLILNSPKVPLTNKIILDEDRLLDLVDHIRQDLPSEFRNAQEICKQRDALLNEAAQEAEAIRAATERQQMQLLSETEIYRLGQAEAERLVYDAQTQIRAQQTQADLYADEVLEELESKVGRALQTIRNGRNVLMGAARG